jgi:gliding motility-associated-like protein
MVDEDHIFDSVEECIMWLHEPGHIENEFKDESELYFPPAFTPNGDNINDDWNIKNIDKYPDAEIEVLNKNGELVFESIGYNEPWNGQLHGELLPAGEYKYRVKLDEGNKKEGSVFIFR